MNSSPEVRLIDISRSLDFTTPCWPGDVPFRFQLSWKMSEGATVNVGSITTSVHTATHCDAPYHYDQSGKTIEQLDLNIFCGKTLVVDVRDSLNDWYAKLKHRDLSQTSRVLFRTGGWTDPSRFPEAIPVMDRDLPGRLADQGVNLIGLDLPSVDQIDSKTLEIHHLLGKNGITIVEGLWLEDVNEGLYELFAFPLKIICSDGSPLRAVLKPIQ